MADSLPVAASARTRDDVVQRTFDVEGHVVHMEVRTLTTTDRDRLAAVVAWLAEEEPTAGVAAWRTFASDVVGANVAFRIDGDDLKAVDAEWWGHVVHRAATALFEVNGMGPEVERLLGTMRRSRRSDSAQVS